MLYQEKSGNPDRGPHLIATNVRLYEGGPRLVTVVVSNAVCYWLFENQLSFSGSICNGFFVASRLVNAPHKAEMLTKNPT
jgi:hypothetical protein